MIIFIPLVFYPGRGWEIQKSLRKQTAFETHASRVQGLSGTHCQSSVCWQTWLQCKQEFINIIFKFDECVTIVYLYNFCALIIVFAVNVIKCYVIIMIIQKISIIQKQKTK